MRKTDLKNETVQDYPKAQSSEINPYCANTINCVVINSFPVAVKEYNNRRVVTFKDIDTVHNRPDGTARKRFNDNKEHFIEGEDYFVRNSDEARFELGVIAPNGLMLLTESGYLMLVKSFTDDLAWEVQRKLVNTYFRAKDMFTAMQTFSQSLLNEVASLKAEIGIMKLALETKKPSQPNFWLWKTRIVKPVIKNLAEYLNVDIRTAYDTVYDHMSAIYGFDKCFAMSQFCTKYYLDSNIDSIATIDAIADSPEYQQEFIEVIHKLMNNSETTVVDNSIVPVSLSVADNIITDKVQEAILPLIHKYNDTSVNGSLTYRRVYSAMNKSNKTWANMKTRYHCKSKKAVLLKCDNYYREFVKTINQLLSESEASPT